MIIYLTLPQILDLHRRALEQSGGLDGIRDLAALTGSLATPRATFDGKDLYPSVVEKAAALGFSLTANHPFNDGNKRVGHAALETVLILNGFEIEAEIDAAERVMLGVAAGTIDRDEFTSWVRTVAVQTDI
ncbi:MAG: type II toxin-antitoxin system death-on-curing family toxin [Myxococcota bacterium]